jgi:hypothetical protein
MGPFPAGAFTPGNVAPPIVLPNGVNINIHVNDAQNTACSKSITVNSPGPCSPTGNPCDNVTITATPGTITVTGLNGSPVAMVQVFNSAWQQVFSCAGNCTIPTQVIPSLPAGTYFVKVSLLSAQWTTVCQKELFIPVPPPGNPGSIGDLVWNDLNRNGIKDPNEPGVPNVPVQLKDCNGNTLQTTQTNSTGFYNFPNLNAGCYRICVDLPTGFEFCLQNQGLNDAVDSDINPTTGCTADITLAQGQNDPTQDAGLCQILPQVGSIGDLVWNDLDQDGVKDPNESGVPNVTVQLKDCNNNTLQTQQTNSAGNYNFPNLQAGCYKVCVLLPNGFQFSPQNQGGNDATDSDMNPGDGCTANINLAPGQNDPTNDAGIYLQTTINLNCKNLAATTTTTSVVISYMEPTGTTTCATGGLTFTRISGPASGSAFPVGTTQVCYRATDACGNSQTCCFNVTVTACPQQSSGFCFISPTKPSQVSAKIDVTMALPTPSVPRWLKLLWTIPMAPIPSVGRTTSTISATW